MRLIVKCERLTNRDRLCVSDEELERFIEKVVRAANRGVAATRNVTMSEPNWSFGQALFFATTVLTTIGTALPWIRLSLAVRTVCPPAFWSVCLFCLSVSMSDCLQALSLIHI